MPWKVFKTGDDDAPYCVHKLTPGGEQGAREPNACHASKAEATEQMDALYADEDDNLSFTPLLAIGLTSENLGPSHTEGGSWFDGMSVGSFVDMMGRKVTIKRSHLAAYLKNTLDQISHAKNSNNEIVGLPIDAKNHERGDAAGWIVDAQIVGDIIQFLARWTDLGRDLIGSDRMRFFSPTLRNRDKRVIGGSLTNWPATVSPEGANLLRPLELSTPKGLFTIDPAMLSGKGDAKMAVEKVKEAAREDEILHLSKADLAELVKDMTASNSKPEAEAEPDKDLEQEIDGLGLTASLSDADKRKIAQTWEKQLELETQQIQLQVSTMLAQKEHEAAVVNFSQRAVGGSDAVPRGLRGVTANELSTELMKLDSDSATFFQGVIDTMLDAGPVNFASNGHGKIVEGAMQLPPDVVAKLDSGDLDLADLNTDIMRESLGDPKQYDRSKWEVK